MAQRVDSQPQPPWFNPAPGLCAEWLSVLTWIFVWVLRFLPAVVHLNCLHHICLYDCVCLCVRTLMVTCDALAPHFPPVNLYLQIPHGVKPINLLQILKEIRIGTPYLKKKKKRECLIFFFSATLLRICEVISSRAVILFFLMSTQAYCSCSVRSR